MKLLKFVILANNISVKKCFALLAKTVYVQHSLSSALSYENVTGSADA